MNGVDVLSLGRYYPVESALHRVDPRVKIGLTCLVLVVLFATRRFPGLALLGCVLALLFVLVRLPVRWFATGMKPVLLLLGVTLALNFFFTPGTPVAGLGPAVITEEGVRQGLFVGLRLILLVLFASFLMLTTTPIALADGIEALLSPLKAVKLPVHEIAMMAAMALRFVPILTGEVGAVVMAQQARGARFGSRNLLDRARSVKPVVIPVLVSAFRRADELAVAMEARGYRGDVARTRLRTLRSSPADWVWLLAGMTVLGLIWLAGG